MAEHGTTAVGAARSIYTDIWTATYAAAFVAASAQRDDAIGGTPEEARFDRCAARAARLAEMAVEAERRRRAAMLAPMAAAVPVEAGPSARPRVEVGDFVTWKAGAHEQSHDVTINAEFWNQPAVAATLTSIRRGGVVIWPVDPVVASIASDEGQKNIRAGLEAIVDENKVRHMFGGIITSEEAHEPDAPKYVAGRWLCPRCMSWSATSYEHALYHMRECEGLGARRSAPTGRAAILAAGERWHCDECGHEHEGPRLAGVCVACPCTRTQPKEGAKR